MRSGKCLKCGSTIIRFDEAALPRKLKKHINVQVISCENCGYIEFYRTE